MNRCVAPERPPLGSVAALEPAFEPLRFRKAVALYQRPGDPDRWYVVEQRGVVWTFRAGDTAATEYLNLEPQVDDGSSEAGLLGMAFHPDFATNGRLFLSYTAAGLPFDSHVVEVAGTLDGMTALGPPQPILSLDQPYVNHNGGDIKFGPDGYLYASFGDGGAAGDPLGNGQDLGTLLGKMLRIDVDGGAPYAIPPDNPFADGGGAAEIFAWGLRNMWRFSFDRETGLLWGGDVGQNKWEEVDVVERGKNYGWNEKEGTHCYGSNPCDDPSWTDPVAEYGHGQGQSVTGGYVYRGTAIPALYGAYVYGDYESGRIWALRDGAAAPDLLLSSGLSISSFGEDAGGELYVIHYAPTQSRVYRLVPAGEGGGTGNLPVLLSQTGCADPDDPRRPARALIPYDVNVPLWSDGAAKRRWLSLPEGGRITVEADGDWTFPVGTVLVKEFSLAGRRIETRLFVRHPDGGWGGYTYEWDASESDATLLAGEKLEPIGDQVWQFPSATQCLQCHSAAAGRSLGPESAQLNRDFPEGAGLAGNQIDWLRGRDLFESDPGEAAGLPALPETTDEAATLEARAKAYLHANCSHCHRPGGVTQAAMDLRYDTPLAQMAVCDVEPLQGDLGKPGAKLLAPGEAKSSLIVLRMHTLGEGRMPDVGSSVVDEQGAHLVAQWIQGMETCP